MQPYSPLAEAHRRAESFEHHDALYEYIPGFRSHTMCNSDGPNASLALSGGMCMRWARNKNRELSCFSPSGYSVFIDYPLFICYSHLCVVPHPAVMPYLFAIPYISACVRARARARVCAAPRKAKAWPNVTPALHCAHRRGACFDVFFGGPMQAGAGCR